MRDYESWSFWDRAFLAAITVSLLWHFFWFFSITITINPKALPEKQKPSIVSLGPVLDDSIFRALLESKPEISEAFYRRLSDFSSTMEVEAKTVQRHEAGGVVSIPFGQKFLNSMRVLVGGEKASPGYDFLPNLKLGYLEEGSGVEGEVKDRRILNRPSFPAEPPGADVVAKSSETELQFVVDPAGNVKDAEVLISSGDPDIDLLWLRYLRKWQFSSLGLDKPALNQKGSVRLRFKSQLAEV